MNTREAVIAASADCETSTGVPELEALFLFYQDGSADRPYYYRFLRRLADSIGSEPQMIELGCRTGGASIHFCSSGGLAYGIDIDAGIVRKHERFHFFHGSSIDTDLVGEFNDHTADVLLIDSDHSYEQVEKELALWGPKVRPGGVILFDDVLTEVFGCSRFWSELCAKHPDKTMPLHHLHPPGFGFGAFFV